MSVSINKFSFTFRFPQSTVNSEAAQKRFKCLICEKGFKYHYELKRHSLVHSDQRDFNCSICGKGFKTKRTLNDHMRSHENKREFECKVCGKSFNFKSCIVIIKSSIKQQRTSSARNRNVKTHLKPKSVLTST